MANKETTMSIEDYNFLQDYKIIKYMLKESEKETGTKVSLEDCLKVEIKESKIIAQFNIPEIIEMEKEDFTKIAFNYIKKRLISEFANEIREDIKKEQ